MLVLIRIMGLQWQGISNALRCCASYVSVVQPKEWYLGSEPGYQIGQRERWDTERGIIGDELVRIGIVWTVFLWCDSVSR